MENYRRVKVCVKTDVGFRSRENEDHFLIIDNKNENYDTSSLGMIFAVADGIGGHKGGAKASRMACKGLVDYYTEQPNSSTARNSPESRLKILENVIRETHLKISRQAGKAKKYEGMGTTLSVLVLLDGMSLVAHVGDSRVYRLRNHRLEKLTYDQTMAQLSVEMGYIGEEEASNHPLRHVLTEAIGQGLDEMQTLMEELREGDVFLLCTDGLHHMVSDDRIKKILEELTPEQGVCDQLVQEALNRGGSDNVTVIVVLVEKITLRESVQDS